MEADTTASRRHATSCRRGPDSIITDLGSTNGTYVNGVRLAANEERILRHRDVVRIGDCRFSYMEREQAANQSLSAADDVERIRSMGTVRVVSPEDWAARDRDAAAALIRLAEVNRIRSSVEFQVKLIDTVFDMVPAARIAIFLLCHASGKFLSETYRDIESGTERFQTNRSVRRQAVTEKIPIVSNDGDSVLCVPLRTDNDVFGLIYAQHPDPEAFNMTSVQLLAAVADICSPSLGNLLECERLQEERERLLAQVESQNRAIVGRTSKVMRLHQKIADVAPTDVTVLITGENGTGKELAARAIHKKSSRSRKPFIVVNCAATPLELKESELFGHEKGSFTGATTQRRGKFEEADGGTLFLDEVGEMPLRLQAALLRVLQESEFERVGGNRVIHADVRVLAATNRNLEQMVREGAFREDLFYRLNVVRLRIPSLAERAEDIPELAAHFVAKHALKLNRPAAGLTLDAERFLVVRDWKGNIRELENTIIATLVYCKSDRIGRDDLRRVLLEPSPVEHKSGDTYKSFTDRAQRWIVQWALDENDGHIPSAARVLEVDDTYVRRLIKALGIGSA
jgi:transcriptional regulator with GAF, ATPase, and Fis domain